MLSHRIRKLGLARLLCHWQDGVGAGVLVALGSLVSRFLFSNQPTQMRLGVALQPGVDLGGMEVD